MYVRKQETESRTKILLWAGLYLVIVLLCSFFVSTHDDYYVPTVGNSLWGSLQYAYAMGNGRYIGNFLGNYLSQRVALNTLLKSVILWGMIRLITSFFPDEKWYSIFTSVLILWPGTDIFAQCYSWSHGFYNYTVPMIFLLAELKLLYRQNDSVWSTILAAICAFCQMLFSENTTVICFLITLAACIRQVYTCRESQNRCVVVLLAAFIGTLLIFIGPKISQTAELMDWYRGTYSLTDLPTLILDMLDNAVNIMRIISGWHLLWGSLIILLGIKIFRKRKALKILFALFLCPALAMMIIHACLNEDDIPHLTAVFALLFVITIVFLLVLTIKCFERKVLLRAAVPVLFAMISAGELLIVYPIGPRCLYITYILIMFFVLILWADTMPAISVKCQHILNWGAIGLLGLTWIILMSSMVPLYQQNKLRVQYINKQLSEGKTTIKVLALPDNGLLWIPNATSQLKYTFNTGNPNKMKFEIVSSLQE